MKSPPPVLDSARLIAFAHNDDEIEYTDCINLFVGEERLGEVPCLAICRNYWHPHDILLLFCDLDWQSKGVIGFETVDEAKAKADRGYHGISKKWMNCPYSDQEVAEYLRNEYNVDPDAEWWKMFCSFCGKENHELDGILASDRAAICRKCAVNVYSLFHERNDA